MIAEVRIFGFMRHVDTTLRFPPRGVVLVTGKNGAGKSSIAEAISVGLWGKTLRGTDPWSAKDGRVEIDFVDGLRVIRSRRTGKASLVFGVGDRDDWAKFETPTKAQEALDSIVGSHEVWRRASVFSSSDAALFSSSTDGERKRFVEGILGVDRFDPALEACRLALRTADREFTAVEADIRVLREKIAGAERRIADAVSVDGDDAPTVDDEAVRASRAKTLADKLVLARSRARAVQGEIQTVTEQTITFGAELSTARREAARLASGTCPTCSQTIPRTMTDALAAQVAAAEARALDVTRTVDVKMVDLREQLDETREAETALSSKLGKLQQQMAAAEATGRQRTATAAARATSERELATATAARVGLEKRLVDATATAATLRAVERVLGLKGVRANILGAALAGLEAATNAWLARLAGEGLRVTLSRDGVAALDVEGAGGGHGYDGASGGERRRIDVAILLGLGEFSAASAGKGGGMLILDEVLDTLDRDGLERACRAIEELAQDRPVLVVSHLEELTATLRPATRWDVDAGAVTVG